MTRISERLRVDVERCIPDNPIQLRWLNTLGGWSTWVFATRQMIAYDVKGGELFSKQITDLADMQGLDEWFGKEAEKVLTLGYEQLSTEKVNFIKGLLYSPKVYVITGTSGAWVRTVVRVKPGSFNIIDTGERKHDLELQIIYPRLFIQQQ